MSSEAFPNQNDLVEFFGSYYMYTESSGSGSNSEAIMYVSCVDPSQWTQLSLVFAYHMYGSAMGTLSIDVSPDSGSTWIEEWTLSGDQGAQWFEAYVDLSAYTSNISVRFQGITGSGFRSDMAIDLVRFIDFSLFGCTDPFADNYDSLAVTDDGSCTYIGCTDPYSLNYCSYCNIWSLKTIYTNSYRIFYFT